MTQFSTATFFGLLLFCVNKAFGYEVCKITTYKTYYCNDGYHCCYDNLQCCSDGLTVGTWVGIVIGIIVFKVIIIFACVRMCRRYRARPGAVLQVRQPVVTTIAAAPPPYTGGPNMNNMANSGAYNTAYSSPANFQQAAPQYKYPTTAPPAYS